MFKKLFPRCHDLSRRNFLVHMRDIGCHAFREQFVTYAWQMARHGASSASSCRLNVAAQTVWNALPSQFRSSSISRGQFIAESKSQLFTQPHGHLWELLLKCVLFYIYIYIYFTLTDFVPPKWHHLACHISGHCENKIRARVRLAIVTEQRSTVYALVW